MELRNISELKIVEPSIKLKNPVLEAMVIASVKKYGQLKPIIIDQNDIIIEGHQVYKALKQCSIDQVWTKKINVPNRKQVYLELNLSQRDVDAVECLLYLKECDLSSAILPWTPSKVSEMLEILNFDWDTYRKNRESDTLF
jgi:hypothetical protein